MTRQSQDSRDPLRKNVTGAGFKIQAITQDGHQNTAAETTDEPELVWKITTQPPEIRFIDLNENSFLDALMYVLER